MSSREKEIDVQRSNYSVIDREFDNMRERFDAEMRRVEEEMSRLRREFESYTPKMQHHAPVSSITNGVGSYHQTSPTHFSPTNNTTGGGEIKRYDPYLENIKSPLIREERDGKTLRLRFDVSQYLPEEITVKTVDNRLFVHAKHEEKSPQRTVYREYNQEFMLPRGTNPEYITSTLSADGVLTVEAPLPAIEGPPSSGYRHPITHK